MNPTPHTEMAPPTRAARCLSAAGRLRLSKTCAALLLALSLSSSFAQVLPSYPLVGIAVDDQRANKTALRNLNAGEVHKFRMIYGSDVANITTKPVQLVRDVANRDPAKTQVIPYMGGYTTNLAPDSEKAQTIFIRGVAMTKVGKLTQWISATAGTTPATAFSITMDTPGSNVLIPRKDNPDEDGAYKITYNVNDQYDSWLRIDDELMQIKSVTYSATTTTVTVVRGYEGSTTAPSTPVPHNANAKVFSPVYLGQSGPNSDRFDQAYPDNSKGNMIRYVLDPGRIEAADLRDVIITDYLNQGYEGAWWDTFNQTFSNMCDARGNEVYAGTGPNTPGETKWIWNFAANTEYTDPIWITTLQSFTNDVRDALPTVPGLPGNPAVVPVVYGNTAFQGGSYHLPGDPLGVGTETLADAAPADANNLLTAGCFEDSFFDYATGANPQFTQLVGADWTKVLGKMINAANGNRPYVCMVGPAGDFARDFNDEETQYDKKLRFAYASYLMAVKVVVAPKLPEDSTLSFGIPLLISPDNTLLPHDADTMPEMRSLPPLFFAQIGNAVTTNSLTGLYPNSGLKLGSTGIYARKFQNGFAAVYPQLDDATYDPEPVPLPTPPAGTVWKDANNPTGATITTLTLSPGDGKILVAVDPTP